MPLFGLIKNKKKTKDRQPEDNNNGSVASTTSTTTTTPTTPTAQATAGGALSNNNNNNSNNTLPAVTKTSSSSSSKDKKINKTKSDQSSLTPVRTISHKTPNPFTATPAINVPKSPTLGSSSPSEVDDSNRMYSSSPFSSSPQPPQPQVPQPQQQQKLSPNQPHLQNVVTGQYNAPPTPPSTARSGSIDDKIDALPSIGASSQPYQHDHLKHPQPQQSYPQYPQQQPSEAMIGTSSGLLTPVPSVSERVIPSRFPSAQQNTLRATKGKYAIVDFSIQRTLGTGSFGRVHLVQSRHNSRFYAIKVHRFPITLTLGPEEAASRQNEASRTHQR
jgi:protein kinase A